MIRRRTALAFVPFVFVPVFAACASPSSGGSPAPVEETSGVVLPVKDAGGDADVPRARADAASDASADASVDALPPAVLAEIRKERTSALQGLVDTFADDSGWPLAVDRSAAKEAVRALVATDDGSDRAFLRETWFAVHAVPQGHQSLSDASYAACFAARAVQHASSFGVCGRPGGDGIVVTVARPGNALGLARGDVVVGLDDERGDALTDGAYARAACGGVHPAPAARRTSGAASFFGGLDEGRVLHVRAPDGTPRTVSVPASDPRNLVDCTDPFARNRRVNGEATTRPDGVAVVRIPSFLPYDRPFPTNPTDADLEAYVSAFRNAVAAEFAKVKDAGTIVWDARGNTGGITPVGLAIVGGFPSARAGALSYCKTRVPASDPPSFDAERYAEYAITTGGPFATHAKMAVLVDGLGYSAGDYFAYATARASDVPLVGTSTAGAFGGGFAPVTLAGPPELTATYDPTACFDARTDEALEGHPAAPSVAAAYDPGAVARGEDPLLEAAVAAAR